MTIPDDDLVLVESFEDLRAGDRVLVRGCCWCGKDEVGLLGNKVSGCLHRPGESTWEDVAFIFLGSVCRRGGNVSAISARVVHERRLYRFREDLEDADREATAQLEGAADVAEMAHTWSAMTEAELEAIKKTGKQPKPVT